MPKKIKAKKTAAKKNLGKRRKNLNIILLFVLVIFFSIIATEIAYLFYKIQYVKVFSAKLEVGNIAAFAIGKQELDFGIIPQGGSATRYIAAENQGSKKLILEIFATGTIKKFIFYESYAYIMPNETKQLPFKASIPESLEAGAYTGKIFLIFKRA